MGAKDGEDNLKPDLKLKRPWVDVRRDPWFSCFEGAAGPDPAAPFFPQMVCGDVGKPAHGRVCLGLPVDDQAMDGASARDIGWRSGPRIVPTRS
jgi:hypothetical protein